MLYSEEELRRIFDKTAGRCHICGEKLAWVNYAKHGSRGAWEVDHSRASAAGGTDDFRNFLPAHISCNRSKRDRSNQQVRAEYGRSKKPMSVAERERAQRESAFASGATGAIVGGLIAGPPGAIVGGLLGRLIGRSVDPEEERPRHRKRK